MHMIVLELLLGADAEMVLQLLTWTWMLHFLGAQKKVKQGESPEREMLFIIEDGDKQGNINSRVCVFDDLHKELINYGQYKHRKSEWARYPWSHRWCVEGLDLVTVYFSYN